MTTFVFIIKAIAAVAGVAMALVALLVIIILLNPPKEYKHQPDEPQQIQ